MYKIIIIDDDFSFCEQLSDVLDWASEGFVIAGLFADGKDAIDYINRHHVDAILSDIKMPDVSGLDLARYCSINYPDIVVALISAHRDFAYAQQAIKYGVTDYITKPITYKQLTDCITKIKEELDELAAMKNNTTDWSSDFEVLAHQQLLSAFLLGMHPDISRFNALLEEQGFDADASTCPVASLCVIIHDFENYISSVWKYGVELFHDAFGRIAASGIKDAHSVILSFSNDRAELIFLAKHGVNNFCEILEQYMNNLRSYCFNLLQLEIEVFPLRISDCLVELNKNTDSVETIHRQCRLITSYLEKNMFSEAKSMLSAILDTFGTSRIFAGVLRTELNTAFPGTASEEIAACLNIHELNAAFETFIEQMQSDKNTADNAENNEIIKKAVDYINENYMKDLTLNSVAAHVCLHPVYFSKYFKSCLNEKFIDYLSRIRIEKAIELLENDSDIKMYALGEMVGYHSTPHFYKLFKSVTGVTPTKYKEELENEKKK